MIFEGIVRLFVDTVVGLLTALLPSDPAPLGGVDLSGIIHLYSWLNSFLPVSTVFEAATLSLQVLGVVAGLYAVMWILQRLHVIGGAT